MRKIKFKAKLKEWKNNSKCNKWVNGYYLSRAETTYCFKEDYEKFPVKILHYIAQERMTDWGLPNDFALYEIDENTICQYTGLKDKNGKEIYEGDIVCFQFDNDNCPFPNKDTKKRFGRIFFLDFRASFSIAMGRNGSKSMNNDLFKYIQGGNRIEVIGNIFDNPELFGMEEK